MLKVEFPEPDFNIRNGAAGDEIFDKLRRKWLRLTPEEWVRQNLINWLIKVQQIPASFIAVEKEITVGELRKRFDIVVFDKTHKPWLLAECKAMEVPLSEKVIQQALSYYTKLSGEVLMISNGHYTYAWQLLNNRLEPVEALPKHA
jgi:hypothetical protein